jgi:3-hydroxyisobutyrate dehydrogenase-like beta-hydroxyacid dehydrogenase
MDLSSFRRGMGAWAGRRAARPDYRVLVATLEAVQSASPAARALRGARVSAQTLPRHDCLVALLLGTPHWREAVAAQGGCFHGEAAAALRRRKPK